ncbi:hypothetical protein BKA56DRAFT_622427 [Ilyonectria sp. MPI-CAGE-AT-0026]|nr:hypothetical protein BKA56DRAFT_622427 [Ilyonectria sp. MPI-CAGE-AT-0026]
MADYLGYVSSAIAYRQQAFLTRQGVDRLLWSSTYYASTMGEPGNGDPSSARARAARRYLGSNEYALGIRPITRVHGMGTTRNANGKIVVEIRESAGLEHRILPPFKGRFKVNGQASRNSSIAVQGKEKLDDWRWAVTPLLKANRKGGRSEEVNQAGPRNRPRLAGSFKPALRQTAKTKTGVMRLTHYDGRGLRHGPARLLSHLEQGSSSFSYAMPGSLAGEAQGARDCRGDCREDRR